MNKNYKENLKNRNIDTRKKKPSFRSDIKEYKISKNSLLLEYLINDLHFARNKAKALLSHHVISINGAPVSQFDFKLSPKDTLIISKQPIKQKNRKDIPIIYEDDEFIAINKPYGLLSIESDTEKSSTAFRMVMDYVQAKDKHNRVFVVHRIDKETSGVLMFCKNEKTRDMLQDKWNEIVLKRGYYAVCEGIFNKKEDHIVNYLRKNKMDLMYIAKGPGEGNYRAVTNYKVIKENSKYSLLDVNIETGRKNQIRVTLGSLGHYVLGEDKYGEPEDPLKRLCLHAYELSFKHPLTGKIYSFKTKIPNEFLSLF